jgi:N utilization substance protein B
MIAMQTLYEWEFREGSDLLEISERNIGEYDGKCEDEFVHLLVKGVSNKRSELDKIIDDAAPEWSAEQISLIDKVILEIAIYELLNLQDIPPKVTINEAVELSKQFGSENSSKFVNGVLGTVYKRYEEQVG